MNVNNKVLLYNFCLAVVIIAGMVVTRSAAPLFLILLSAYSDKNP